MKRWLLTFALLALLSLLPFPGQAQTTSGVLRDIREFMFLLEDLSQDAETCGVTQEGIRQAVVAPAGSAPFTFEGWSPIFSVSVLTLNSGAICASYVDIEVYYHQEVELPNLAEGAFTNVVLWREGTIALSPQDEHGLHVEDATRNLTQDFVHDWNLDNDEIQ